MNIDSLVRRKATRNILLRFTPEIKMGDLYVVEESSSNTRRFERISIEEILISGKKIKTTELYEKYVCFMEDYKEKQHMSLASSQDICNSKVLYFLTHQPVIKPELQHKAQSCLRCVSEIG